MTRFTLDMRDGLVAVTWENGTPLTLHLCTEGADLTLIVGIQAVRQIRQMLSWADAHPSVLSDGVGTTYSALPPEVYRG